MCIAAEKTDIRPPCEMDELLDTIGSGLASHEARE